MPAFALRGFLGFGHTGTGRLCLMLLSAHLTTAAAAGGTAMLPPRPAQAPAGSGVARAVSGLSLPAREAVLVREVLSGNVPDFLRRFVEVTLTEGENRLGLWVAPDYLAVGSGTDFFRTPLTPSAAKSVARRAHCTLPTRKMVDAIYRAAAVKLPPLPRPPWPDMTTVPAFLDYQKSVRAQREALLEKFPPGALVAGHQKDIVLTPQLTENSGKVAIYGWHRPDGTPIQPLYTGHAETWVDYSHGVRLVAREVTLNGRASTVERILADPQTAPLLSDEPFSSMDGGPAPLKTEPERAAVFGETLTTLHPEPGVRITVNRPANRDPARPVQLIVYALPNGNTIEQTMGHRPAAGEDWRFGIQHIAAQTRWLRKHQPEVTRIAAYVECAEQSWPAWGRKHPDSDTRVAAIMEKLRQQVAVPSAKLVLTGHSGGGSFIFHYLNSRDRIQDDVERIAFLESNYAYDAGKGHAAKLTTWLKAAPDRFLTVIAYHDSVALLNGKTFVTEAGGTWGRSHAMLEDLEKSFTFSQLTEGPLHRHQALDGRISFFLMENPEKVILHTKLVERNGYLHALLTGTRQAQGDYRFFSEPVYLNLISGP